MAFPPMIKMRRKEAVEIISETLLELLTFHRGLRNCLLQNTSFKFSRRRRHRRHMASFDCTANRRKSFMAHGTLHRVLTHEPICFRTYYALKVVGQKIFEIHTKHRYFPLPAAYCSGSLAPCQELNEPRCSMPHSSRQLSSCEESSRAQYVRDLFSTSPFLPES